MSNLSRVEREELNALSKNVFGTSSRWQKLVNSGYVELVTEETTELVPGKTESEEPTTRKVNVPVKRSDGGFQSVVKRYTVESIKQYMIERKAKLDEVREMIRQQQEEAKKKKEAEALAKKIQEDVGGSALG